MVQPQVDVIHQVLTSTLKTYFQYLKPIPVEGTSLSDDALRDPAL
jgi:hypothetical protein